jgi:hypothetical protein
MRTEPILEFNARTAPGLLKASKDSCKNSFNYLLTSTRGSDTLRPPRNNFAGRSSRRPDVLLSLLQTAEPGSIQNAQLETQLVDALRFPPFVMETR